MLKEISNDFRKPVHFVKNHRVTAVILSPLYCDYWIIAVVSRLLC